MQVKRLEIEDVLLITPRRFGDGRGSFCETYSARAWRAAGIEAVFVQDNQSCSRSAGTLRGLHFQIPPAAQAKLVRVLRGAVLDVAVDLRRGSATYGRHVAQRLDAETGAQLFIPVGFAHGLCTLEPDSEVLYKVSDFYAPEYDKGLAWDDPALGIAWPVAAEAAVLSTKDRTHPRLAALPAYFHAREPAA